MLIVSVPITVSVHASVSISALVTVYCYFRHPGALPPPSPQLLQLPFCSVIPGTGSLNNPLSPGAEKCHPEKAAQSTITVRILTETSSAESLAPRITPRRTPRTPSSPRLRSTSALTSRLSSTATTTAAHRSFSRSRRPAQIFPRICAGDLRCGDLAREELLEGIRDLLGRARLDDAPVWQAVAQELVEAPGSR